MRQKTFTNSQLLDAIRNRANKFQLTERFATAQNYLSTARSFSQYIILRDSAHALFNAAIVQDYSRYLQTERRVLRNTQSFYLRFLRATYCAMGGCADVFKDAYTSVEPTRKRALPAHVIKRLDSLPLKGRYAMWRDMFLFSFAARGMAFVDMAYLRQSDIRGGYITYCRHKTGRPLTVKLEPCMQQIITRWSPTTLHTDTNHSNFHPGYVFPIIRSSGAKGFTEYQSALSAYNKALRSIAARVGLAKCGLTTLSSYTARHTWATQAYHAGIPVSVISEGMGHSTEKVTRIYLAQLTPTIIDRYNHTLLNSIGFR